MYPVAGSAFNIEAVGSTPSGSGVTVTADDGTSTGQLSWSSPNTYQDNSSGNNNADLLSGYLDNNGSTPSTATLTLPASIAGTGTTPYNLYIYIAGDTPGRYGTSTVNGGTPITLTEGSGNNGVFVEASPSQTAGTAAAEGNYYEFTGLTGTTLTISNLGVGGPDGTPRLPFDGFQVVSTPEPACAGLLGMAVMGLIARRRRMNRE